LIAGYVYFDVIQKEAFTLKIYDNITTFA